VEALDLVALRNSNMPDRICNLLEREAGHIVVGLVFAIYGALFAHFVDHATGIAMAWAASGWIGRSMGVAAAAPAQLTRQSYSPPTGGPT
jgi:hypothetical protein